jgi:molybdenum cofactor cytidylyltransferase
MSRAPNFAAVILAAGESTRMRADKSLLPWPPSLTGASESKDTFLSAVIHSLTSAADFVLVVAGKNEAALAPVIYASGASMAINPNPGRGQFSSLQVGLREVLNRGRDAAIITLVDRPPVRTTTIQHLCDAFMAAAGNRQWAVIPEYDGKHGHPFLAGRELIEAFLQAPDTSSAREVEHQNQQRIAYLPVDDPFIALNIDTPEDYAALLAHPPSQS